MISLLTSLLKKAWYTHRYHHIIGVYPGVAHQCWNMPYPVVLFRDGQRVTKNNDEDSKLKGRLAVSIDSNGRISEIWYKE